MLASSATFGSSKSAIWKDQASGLRGLPAVAKLRLLRKLGSGWIQSEVDRALLRLRLIPSIQIEDERDINCQPFARSDLSGTYSLSEEEIAFFADNGFLPPFDVLSKDEAGRLRQTLVDEIMTGQVVYGPYPDVDPVERSAKMHELGLRDDVVSRGFNRHFNIDAYADVLSRPAITERLASLFGRDVYLWRSQFFETAEHATGTSLHQATTFQMAMNKVVLRPKPDENIPASLINITAWVALQDVNEDNAALVLVPGSHATNRFEQYYTSEENRRALLALQPRFDRMLYMLVRELGMRGSHFHLTQLIALAVAKHDDQIRLEPGVVKTMGMKAGQAVVFTSRVIHGSHPNTTGVPRRALAGRYTSEAVDVYPEAGPYVMTNHFRPLQPVLLEKYQHPLKVLGLDTTAKPSAGHG